MSSQNPIVISAAGYGGSGSSAITDLLAEYENVCAVREHEVWFLQDYNAFPNLKNFCLDNNHRSITPLAIDDFEKYARENAQFYSERFGIDFYSLCIELLDELTDVTFKKATHFTQLGKVSRLWYFQILPRLWRIFLLISRESSFERSAPRPLSLQRYSAPDYSRFKRAAKSFLYNFFAAVNSDSHPFIALDQLVSPYQVESVLPFFEDLRVVIVDRDPRDLFILNEHVWKNAPYICDTSDVSEFVNWYRALRKHRLLKDASKANVLQINFEDLVHQYSETVRTIETFLNLEPSKHINKFKYLVPERSAINTRLWLNPEYSPSADKIDYICSELSEYLYE